MKIKEIGEKNRPLNEYENAIIVFDDILDTLSTKHLGRFFIKGRENKLDIYYLSQTYFDLPKRKIRKSSNKKILLYKASKDKENIYGDVGGYNMDYDEFKHICRNSSE